MLMLFKLVVYEQWIQRLHRGKHDLYDERYTTPGP